MKINCVYLGCVPFREDNIINPEKELLDGTHTEGFYLANVLEKYSHNMVFCSVNKRVFNSNGVEFVNYAEFNDYIKYYDFDNVFVMVSIDDHTIKKIRCKHLYIMPSCEKIYCEVNEDNLSNIHRLCYLSEHQKQSFIKNGNEPLYFLEKNQSLFLKWFNAIDESLYQGVNDAEKTNSMVWSSIDVRGLHWFKDNILPLILKEVPDFKLYVCNYFDDHGECYTKDGVIFYLGKLSKEELAEYQRKAKIWVYPNLGITENFIFFNETFCNTAVENAMAGNAIVCLDKGGLSSTLSGYSCLIDGDIFNEKVMMYDDDFNRVFSALGERSIRILKDDAYRLDLVSELKKISEQYTLKSFEDFWVKELKLNFR